jgi:3-oxoacyl-[acyl-carrier protein] reductase
MSYNLDFTNKTVLITGATRGIGKSMAEHFDVCQAKLILTGTNKNQVVELNKKAKDDGKDHHYFAVDFSDKDQTFNFIKNLDAFDVIDVCVNNAGINRVNLVEDAQEEDWNDMMNVNLKAPFLLIQYLSKKMKANGYGRIVNVASIFSIVSSVKRSTYSATKFGLHGLTVSTSLEFAKHNVLINTISPGFIETDLTKQNLSDQEQKELADAVPAKRFGKVDEIAKTVLFLTSDLNTYLTGQNIVVDGGYINA